MANRTAEFKTNHGVFSVELFEDKAPKTTKNFIDLTEKSFYDGVVFHRVIDGFMIQGGIPRDRAGEGLATIFPTSSIPTWATVARESSPWPMPDPTPGAPSSSSLWRPHPGWMASMRCSER
jgi:hypothetical protein